MGAAAAIVLNDGQTTPVANTFAPEEISPKLSSFAERSSSTSIGYKRIRVGSTFAGKTSKVNRARTTFEVPLVQTIDGVATLVGTCRADVSFVYPDVATDQNRKDTYAFVQNSLANSLVRGALRDLDPIY